MPKGKGKGGIDWFEKDKNGQIKLENFINTLRSMKQKDVQEVLKKNKVDTPTMQQTIVLYLYEQNPMTIQHSKLAIALNSTEKDMPLIQFGTKDVMDYKNSLKKEAL